MPTTLPATPSIFQVLVTAFSLVSTIETVLSPVSADHLLGARDPHRHRGGHGRGVDLDQLVVSGEADQGRRFCGRRTRGERQQRHADEISESFPGSHAISSSC
jgi:hypothetical protein